MGDGLYVSLVTNLHCYLFNNTTELYILSCFNTKEKMGVIFNNGQITPFACCINISYQLCMLKSGRVRKVCHNCESNEDVLCDISIFMKKVSAHRLFESLKNQFVKCDIGLKNNLIHIVKCQCDRRKTFLKRDDIIDGSQ